jgi:C4-dicarboxylate-specific signal transduction histidine kinase
MPLHRVLVVDDDAEVRESLYDELCGSFEVETAANGEQALAALGGRAFDVVVSDLRMPDITGVEVLERAKELQPEIVRVLLTGFLDESARQATLTSGAPYKIGKPWHDALEVTLRRALENREQNRRLSAMARDLASFARVDDDLATADGPEELATHLVRWAERVPGIHRLRVTEHGPGRQRVLAQIQNDRAEGTGTWVLEEELLPGGVLRASGAGIGEPARRAALALVERARRWAKDDVASRLARGAMSSAEARRRLLAVARRANVGTMAAGIVHGLASLVQHFHIAAFALEPLMREYAARDPQLHADLQAATSAGAQMAELLRTLRAFVASGAPTIERLGVGQIVDLATMLTTTCTRGGVTVCVGRIPDAEVFADRTLLVQVLVNLIHNAVEASPARGVVDIEVSTAGGAVRFIVTDDGEGVPEELVPRMFEPFASSKDAATNCGLGLALSAQIVQELGGQLEYRRHGERGAQFTVRLPLAR